MPSLSRHRLATAKCDIKRVTQTAGHTELPTPYLAEVPCIPIMPRSTGYQDADRKASGVSASIVGYETVVFGDYDILKGDVLTADGKDYPITDVYPYPVRDPFIVLALADPQANVEPDSAFLR